MALPIWKNVLLTFLLAYITLFRWVWAEAVFDGTVGPAGTLSGKMEIPQSQGTTVGNNLFHSFSTFNINSGESALFTGSSTLSNIISRVTGASASTIDGALDHNMPNASFWLLNPNGILFGPNASLPTMGAFHATTADYLLFEEGGRFGADSSLPENNVLRMSDPSAFGFIGSHPGSITVEKSKLITTQGADLSLAGGDIEVNEGTIAADKGNINLLSVDSVGEALISTHGIDIVAFSQSGVIKIQDSTIGKSENASGELQTGLISIQGGELVIENSNIKAHTHNQTEDTGNIHVVSDQVTLSNSNITTVTSQQLGEHGGDISMIASELIELGNKSTISAITHSNKNGGDINISVDSLVLNNGSMIKTHVNTVDTTGNTGSIHINARNTLTIEGSIITAATEGAGDAGDLWISAPVVDLDTALLSVSSRFGEGDGGSITLHNIGQLSLSNISRILANTWGIGNSGQIDIEAHSIAINDRSVISSSTSALGNAGNITIDATGTVTLQTDTLITSIYKGPRITSAALGSNPDALGSAGTITLNANRLNILNGGTISTDTQSNQGSPANIHIVVNDLLIQSNDPFYARYAVSVLEKGEQPNIPIAGISSNATAHVPGGNITLNVSNQVRLFSGVISATASGSGSGGNIAIGNNTSPVGLFVIDNNSAVLAHAQQGNGGNIFIFPDALFHSKYSTISSDSVLGVSGMVEIDNVDQGNTDSFFDLDKPMMESNKMISQTCDTDRIHNQGSLIVEGQGGLRLSPGDYIPSKISRALTDRYAVSNRAVLDNRASIGPVAETLSTPVEDLN
jgi:filamentous hemagglutinin family protein